MLSTETVGRANMRTGQTKGRKQKNLRKGLVKQQVWQELILSFIKVISASI